MKTLEQIKLAYSSGQQELLDVLDRITYNAYAAAKGRYNQMEETLPYGMQPFLYLKLQEMGFTVSHGRIDIEKGLRGLIISGWA